MQQYKVQRRLDIKERQAFANTCPKELILIQKHSNKKADTILLILKQQGPTFLLNTEKRCMKHEAPEAKMTQSGSLGYCNN